MEVDGPPRMVGWITWSGRERSSQTQFLPVPGVRLIHPIYKSLFSLDFVLSNKDLCHLTVSLKARTLNEVSNWVSFSQAEKDLAWKRIRADGTAMRFQRQAKDSKAVDI